MKAILNPMYNLYRKEDQVFCDSLQVAEAFERSHSHILRAIQTIGQSTSGLSKEFIKDNYKKASYINSQGKRQPKYFLTKNGFTMLAMEFKTAKARAFKEAYIKQFDAMADFITVLSEVKEDFPEFTEAVKLAHAEPKPYHYSNEINMLYSIVLNQSVPSFKKLHGITGGSIRDYLTKEQLQQFRKLQRMDIGLLIAVPEASKRKEILCSV